MLRPVESNYALSALDQDWITLPRALPWAIHFAPLALRSKQVVRHTFRNHVFYQRPKARAECRLLGYNTPEDGPFRKSHEAS